MSDITPPHQLATYFEELQSHWQDQREFGKLAGLGVLRGLGQIARGTKSVSGRYIKQAEIKSIYTTFGEIARQVENTPSDVIVKNLDDFIHHFVLNRTPGTGSVVPAVDFYKSRMLPNLVHALQTPGLNYDTHLINSGMRLVDVVMKASPLRVISAAQETDYARILDSFNVGKKQ